MINAEISSYQPAATYHLKNSLVIYRHKECASPRWHGGGGGGGKNDYFDDYMTAVGPKV